MNKVLLIGRLTRDPELSETTSGIKVCRFALAVNRNYPNADGEKIADFFNCIVWRGLAEVVARYARQGNRIAVVGSLETRSYEDKQGNKRTAYELIASEVELLERKKVEEETNYEPAPKAAIKESPKPKAKLEPIDDGIDIPF